MDAGNQIGKCEIIEKLGSGSHGTVYKAKHLILHKIVAVKLLNIRSDEDKKLWETIVSNVRMASQLEHANIISIYDVGEENGQYYITMQFMDGNNLNDYIQQNKISIDWLLNLAQEVTKALQVAHTKGVLHRNLKPSNILISSNQEIKLSDFGIVNSLQFGSLLYTSPEEVAGTTGLDGRSDLYSLGGVLYHALVGEPLQQEQQDGYNSILPIREKNPDVSEELENIILQLLAKKTLERYASALEVLNALESVRNELIAKKRQRSTGNPNQSSYRLGQIANTSRRIRKDREKEISNDTSSSRRVLPHIQRKENRKEEPVQERHEYSEQSVVGIEELGEQSFIRTKTERYLNPDTDVSKTANILTPNSLSMPIPAAVSKTTNIANPNAPIMPIPAMVSRTTNIANPNASIMPIPAAVSKTTNIANPSVPIMPIPAMVSKTANITNPNAPIMPIPAAVSKTTNITNPNTPIMPIPAMVSKTANIANPNVPIMPIPAMASKTANIANPNAPIMPISAGISKTSNISNVASNMKIGNLPNNLQDTPSNGFQKLPTSTPPPTPTVNSLFRSSKIIGTSEQSFDKSQVSSNHVSEAETKMIEAETKTMQKLFSANVISPIATNQTQPNYANYLPPQAVSSVVLNSSKPSSENVTVRFSNSESAQSIQTKTPASEENSSASESSPKLVITNKLLASDADIPPPIMLNLNAKPLSGIQPVSFALPKGIWSSQANSSPSSNTASPNTPTPVIENSNSIAPLSNKVEPIVEESKNFKTILPPHTPSTKKLKKEDVPIPESHHALWVVLSIFLVLVFILTGWIILPKHNVIDISQQFQGYLEKNDFDGAGRYLEQQQTLSILEKREWQEQIKMSEQNYYQKMLQDRGWFGEEIPSGMKRDAKIGQYIWTRDSSSMVYIAGGDFMRGTNKRDKNERPMRKINVPAFYMDKYELTTAQYKLFQSQTGYHDGSIDTQSHQPMTNISWENAKEYASWVDKRLPTEMEWEKAARGGIMIPEWENNSLPIPMKKNLLPTRTYPWGEESPDATEKLFCNYKQAGKSRSLANVGSFPTDVSPYRCYDMAGNASEWCNDIYQEYDIKEFKPKANQPTSRSVRGGSCDTLLENLRCTRRWQFIEKIRYPDLGVRLAK